MNTDNITSVTTQTFDVSAPAGWYIEFYLDGNLLGSQQLAVGQTTYSFTTPQLANGLHTAILKVAENAALMAANLSNVSAPLQFTIDTLAPGAPGGLDLTGTDSGPFSDDNVTNDNTPTFDWTAASPGTGSAIARYWWAVDDNTPATGGTQILAGFPLTATPSVGNGMHMFYVVAEDAAGNISTPPTGLLFIIDTIAPKVSRVLVGSTEWTSGFRNQLVTLGAGTTDGYGVPSGSHQLDPIWFINSNQIAIQFDGPVDVQQGDLTLTGFSVSNYTITGFSASQLDVEHRGVDAEPIDRQRRPNDQTGGHRQHRRPRHRRQQARRRVDHQRQARTPRATARRAAIFNSDSTRFPPT